MGLSVNVTLTGGTMCDITDYLNGDAQTTIETACLGVNPALRPSVDYLTRCLSSVLAYGHDGQVPDAAAYRTALNEALATVVPMAAKLSNHRNLQLVAATMNNAGNAAFRDWAAELELRGQPIDGLDIPADQDLSALRKRR
jgi:hypothetical protein